MVRGFLLGVGLVAAVPAAAQTVYLPDKCQAKSEKPNFHVGLLGSSLPGGPRSVGFAKFASGKDMVQLNLDNGPAAYNLFGTGGVKISMIQMDYAVGPKTPKELLPAELAIDVQIGAKKAPGSDDENRYTFANGGKTINVVLPIERLIQAKSLESEKGDWRFTLLYKGKAVAVAVVKAAELAKAKAEAAKAWDTLRAAFDAGKCKA